MTTVMRVATRGPMETRPVWEAEKRYGGDAKMMEEMTLRVTSQQVVRP